MGGTNAPDRAFAYLADDFGFLFGVNGNGQAGEFDIAETHRIFGSENPQAIGVFFRLAEAESETGKQFFADEVKLLPTFE